jgi:hypothetical protein
VGDNGDQDYFTGGSFALFIQRVNEPLGSQALNDGADQTAFINSCGQINTYHFEAQAGDRIQLSVVAGSKRGVYPKMELYDPDGCFLDEAQGYDGSGYHIPPPGLIQLAASKSGTHTVLVRSLFNDQGAYRLKLGLSQPGQ